MKLLDRISEALGLYEEDDEIIEETPSEQPEENFHTNGAKAG